MRLSRRESTYKQQTNRQGGKPLQGRRVEKQNVVLLDVRFVLLTSALLRPLFLEVFHFSLSAASAVPLFLRRSPSERLASPARVGANGAVLPL